MCAYDNIRRTHDVYKLHNLNEEVTYTFRRSKKIVRMLLTTITAHNVTSTSLNIEVCYTLHQQLYLKEYKKGRAKRVP